MPSITGMHTPNSGMHAYMQQEVRIDAALPVAVGSEARDNLKVMSWT